MGNAGRREFIQVLRLMEDFHQHHVEQAVAEALRLGAISFDALKMLLLARLENRPARLDLTFTLAQEAHERLRVIIAPPQGTARRPSEPPERLLHVGVREFVRAGFPSARLKTQHRRPDAVKHGRMKFDTA